MITTTESLETINRVLYTTDFQSAEVSMETRNDNSVSFDVSVQRQEEPVFVSLYIRDDEVVVITEKFGNDGGAKSQVSNVCTTEQLTSLLAEALA